MEAPDVIFLATTTREWNNVGFAGIACTTKEDIIEPIKYIRADLVELTWQDLKLICEIEDRYWNEEFDRYTKMTTQEYYEEVLRRFNEQRKKK